MTRLVFVTQVIDPDDPILGATIDLAGALAARCERLMVVANEVRARPSIDAEIVSLGKENGASRARRTARYLHVIRRAALEMRADALLAHMSPVYLNLAAPVARARRMRLLLWYAHPGRSAQVRLAARVADVVLTSLPGVFPFPSDRVRHIGQAIDVGAFGYSPPERREGGLRLLALGRTSSVKGYPTLIRAVARARAAGVEAALTIVAPSSTPDERRHRDELLRLIEDCSLREAVALGPGVPRAAVPELLRSADAVVNATRTGSGDKTVFEAMAVGRPVLLSNRAFAPLVAGLPVDALFEPGDDRGLAERIVALAALPIQARDAVGRELRARIESGHSLDHWADAVVQAASGP